MPATLTVEQASKILGVSKSSAYASVRSNSFPCPVIKIGGRYVVPIQPLLDLLGINELPEPAATA